MNCEAEDRALQNFVEILGDFAELTDFGAGWVLVEYIMKNPVDFGSGCRIWSRNLGCLTLSVSFADSENGR